MADREEFSEEDFNLHEIYKEATDDEDLPRSSTSMSNVPGSSQKDKKIADKEKLINLIKEHSVIWNFKNKKHRNLGAVGNAWKKISCSMNWSVSECKKKWKSIKNSRNYHKKKRDKSQKSGADNTDPDDAVFLDLTPKGDDDEDFDEDWELENSLKFLEDPECKKSTFSFFSEIDEENDSSTGAYSYATSSKKKLKTENSSSNIDKINSTLQLMISAEKKQKYQGTDDLVHYHMWKNFDNMVQDFPKDKILKLNLDIMQLIYKLSSE